MRTEELDYALPPELIAQVPAEPRDAARLLTYERASGRSRHRRFADLPALLRPDDVVVVNATRVLRARLRGRRTTGGAAEVLLLEPRPDGGWEALVRPARRLPPGAVVRCGNVEVTVEERLGAGRALVRLAAEGPIAAAIERSGELPLPPYIDEPPRDPERYQTVYARTPGSAAAPTAGLHFTPALIAAVAARCTLFEVDLRVGLDTFRPVTVADLDEHPLHSEAYAVDPAVRAAIVAARDAGQRIVAVGTTTARVLETIADPAAPAAGRTALKLQPGHEFRLVSALVTNFHLPRSTLLALVMAFAGVSELRALYELAIAERYRFYSLGDAMLLE